MAINWRRQWHPTPVLLPGKSHGQRSLVGYNPLDCKESGQDWATSLPLSKEVPLKKKKKDFQRGSLVISKVKRKGSSLILKKLICQNMGRVSSCCPGEVLEGHFSCLHLGSWTVGKLSNSLRDSSLLNISSVYIIPFILKVLCKH